MDVLKSEGWCIDEIKLAEALGDDYDKNAKKDVLKNLLLDLDIKEFGSAVVGEKTSNGKTLKGPLVLQLIKWNNTSYPKIAEKTENNGVHVSLLTDGFKPIKAMATEPVNKLDGRTPYGSKVVLSGDITIESGILQLTNKNTTVIGGNVERLVEKWKAEKLGNKENRGHGSSGAPSWVPFGKKNTDAVDKVDKDFKALKKDENSSKGEGNTDFDAARKAEIENLKAVKNTVNLPATNVELDDKPKNNQDSDRKKEYPKRDNKKFDNRGSSERGNTRGGRGRRRDNDDDHSDYSRPRTTNSIFDSCVRPNLSSADHVSDKFDRMNVNDGHSSRGRRNFDDAGRGSRGRGTNFHNQGRTSPPRGNFRSRGRGNFSSRNEYDDSFPSLNNSESTGRDNGRWDHQPTSQFNYNKPRGRGDFQSSGYRNNDNRNQERSSHYDNHRGQSNFQSSGPNRGRGRDFQPDRSNDRKNTSPDRQPFSESGSRGKPRGRVFVNSRMRGNRGQ